MAEIDFVLTYLDSNDPEWQKSRNAYRPDQNSDVNKNRYRDWDNLQYFFRSIEQYAPWVRKIHVVTCGHVPAWLNTAHPKVNIVRHEDYLPAKWLPTFSSRCIDMNLHRIKNLAEQFVYFNDDMFLTSPTTPEDFFRNGLPCDIAVLSPQAFKMTKGISMHIAPIIGAAVINNHFDKNKVMKQNFGKWFTLKYGKEIFRTLTLGVYPHFIGFKNPHLPYSYLKSTYEIVWAKEPELLTQASEHRFRNVTDLNHWIFTYWQLASGQFAPRSTSFGRCIQLHDLGDAKNVATLVTGHKYKVVCVNDAVFDDADFDAIKKTVNDAFASVFPEKSKYET